jgi:SAM-dependent methyltransferase
MLEEAYHALHALEENHWWYVGARHVYRTLMRIGTRGDAKNLRMLEIGCGSGGNLTLLGEYGPTVGAELSYSALNLVRERPALGLVQASATALPFASQVFDGVHLLGVIEHIEDDREALREADRVCRSNGFITLLTSALPFLWSHHDEANLHKRRYWKKQLTTRLIQSGLQPVRVSYPNFFVFIPVWLVRVFQRFTRTSPAYDMGTPSQFTNSILILLGRLEAWLIRFIPLPIGVDLVAVCRPMNQE